VVKTGEVHVWRVPLDELNPEMLPEPDGEVRARASRFRSAENTRRYLVAQGSLRAILGQQTEEPLEFAITERGKPYLLHTPDLKFNLARSRGMSLVAVAMGVEVGVDVERLRTLPELQEIAERFFLPGEAAELLERPEPEREREFFRLWTRTEAMLKARGVGLYGAGSPLDGEWTVAEVDAGEGFAAAVAAEQHGMKVVVHDFRAAALSRVMSKRH
jgi:4'-phosphopantetheinyl transferase